VWLAKNVSNLVRSAAGLKEKPGLVRRRFEELLRPLQHAALQLRDHVLVLSQADRWRKYVLERETSKASLRLGERDQRGGHGRCADAASLGLAPTDLRRSDPGALECPSTTSEPRPRRQTSTVVCSPNLDSAGSHTASAQARRRPHRPRCRQRRARRRPLLPPRGTPRRRRLVSLVANVSHQCLFERLA